VIDFVLAALGSARVAYVGAHSANVLHEPGIAAHEAGGRPADLGAVVVEPNALGHFGNVLFPKAGIRTVLALLSTVDASVDTILMFFVGHLDLLQLSKRTRGVAVPALEPSKSGKFYAAQQ